MVNNIIHGDALTELKKMPDNSIDLLLSDPPYKVISGGRGGVGDRPSGILTKNDGKIFTHNDIEFRDWLPEAYRVLKPETHAYIFTNVLNLQNLLNEATKVGFQLHNLLVWEKNNCTPSRWYMKNAEYVLFLRKGKAKSIRHNGSKTVHKFDNILGDKLHPTQKPVDLLKLYILNSTNENDIVLDPFMGSGSTAVACIETNRQYIGFEMDDQYYEIAKSRIAGAKNEE